MRFWIAALLLLAATPAPAADPCGGNGVMVQVLGSGGPEFSARRAGSSYLLWIDGKARLLIDTGSGASLHFAKSGAAFADLDAILFTQLLADHTVDLPAFIHGSKAEDRNRPLPVYGPPGGRGMPSTITFVRDLFDSTRGTFRHLGEFIAPLDKSSYKLEPHDVRAPPPKLGTPRPAGPMPIAVFRNERLQVRALGGVRSSVPTLAYRIDTGGKAIVFGGSGESPGLSALAAAASLLVTDHAVPEAPGGTPAAGPLRPAQLGELAQTARAGRFLLSPRLSETFGREDDTLAAIRRHYKGPVDFAEDLSCYRP